MSDPESATRPPQRLWGPEVLGEREALIDEAERIAHLGTWAWDMNSGQVAWSEELFRILGKELGRDAATFDNFILSIHPEDRERVQQMSMRAASGGDLPERADFRVVRPDGSVREVFGLAQVFRNAAGVPHRMVGTMMDVTDARRTERSREHALHHLEDAQRLAQLGSFTYDPSNGEMEWSTQVYRILGLAPETKPSFPAFLERLVPEDRPHAAELEATMRAMRDFEASEHRVLRPNGEIRYVRIDGRPREEAGSVRFLGTIVDLTDRRLLELELMQSQKMEALGRLAGGVAHDFNNLLTVILLNAEALRRTRNTRDEHLEQIHEAAGRAAALTSQLLAFSRRSADRVGALDLNGSIANALRLLQRVIGEDVEMIFEPSENRPVVLGSDAQLHQVLLNLAVNARDAMPRGGRLHISTQLVSGTSSTGGNRPFVRLSVRDTGTGMDAATRARLFEPFFTTKEPGKGTGLGLSTVFGIVNQAGGHVEVESEPGSGSTFHVFLPCVAIDPEVLAARETNPPARGVETILVLEDEDAVRTAVCNLLRDAGYEVIASGRPQSALELFTRSRSRVALLLTDIVMPEVNGREIAARLRLERPELPVVFMTGYDPEPGGTPDERTYWIGKPFAPDALLELIRRAIAGQP